MSWERKILNRKPEHETLAQEELKEQENVIVRGNGISMNAGFFFNQKMNLL